MNIDKLTRLIVIVGFFLINSGAYSQSCKVDSLTDLLNSGRYFEAKELYNEICDSVSPDIDCYYKFRMAEAMNRKEAAASELERALKQCPDLFGSATIDIYALLYSTYRDLRKDDKVTEIYKKAKKHLRKNPYNINKEALKLLKKSIDQSYDNFKETSSQPSFKIMRKATPASINIEDSIMLGFKAKFNGVSKRTIFDTGVDAYVVMRKTTAKEIGVRLKADTKGLMNGVEMMGQKNIVDSIEIGNITLYNIPAIIYDFDLASCLPDSIKNDSSIMARFNMGNDWLENPIIGLPSILSIGKIEMDWENKKITFPHENPSACPKDSNNLFTFNNLLYLYLDINNMPFTGLLDFGSDSYIDIDTVFYQKNQTNIPIDTVKVKKKMNLAISHTVQIDVPYMIADNPMVALDRKEMNLDNKHNILIYPVVISSRTSDGMVGVEFLRSIGKRVLLDLDNMRLEAIE